MEKKYLAIIMIIVMVLSLGACSAKPTNVSVGDNTTTDDVVDIDYSEYTDIYTALQVEYLSDRSIQHNDTNKCSNLLFSLQDASSNRLTAAATVDIKIINDNNETVYEAVKTIDSSDYSTWTSALLGSRLLASINIYDCEIDEGTTASGKIYFTVYNTTYFSFEETVLTITDNLPTKQTVVKLPELPKEINTYSYNGHIEATIKITDITYEIKQNNIYFYFTGEKTYDKEGQFNSSYCYVGWKLYDSDGYVVKSGTLMTDKLYTNEKFRDKKEYAFDCISPGKSYFLIISSVY